MEKARGCTSRVFSLGMAPLTGDLVCGVRWRQNILGMFPGLETLDGVAELQVAKLAGGEEQNGAKR